MVMLRLTDIFLLPIEVNREECYIRKKKSVKCKLLFIGAIPLVVVLMVVYSAALPY